MVNKIIKTLFILSISLFTVQGSYADEIDSTLKRLDISGFVRFRHWNTSSKSQLGNKFDYSDSYQNAYYEDMFMRNRLYLNVLPNLQVRTVFDIFAVMGKGDFALGSGSTNLITRDVYVVLRPTRESEISFGLRPFSLPGGYILARDGSGILYSQSLFKKSLNIYAAAIRAYDDADGSYGDNSNPADYSDDNIYYGGMKIKLIPSLSSEIYYANENDQYYTKAADSDNDTRKSFLNWVGFHNKLVFGNFLLRLGGIYNWGVIKNRSATSNTFAGTDIESALFEFECGYKIGDFGFSLVAEGATGDVNDPDAESSFQDIKSAHGFSHIIVDNMGGLMFRGPGESNWYGMYGGGLKIKYILFDTITMEMKFYDFRTTKMLKWDGRSTNWLGSEADLHAEYLYRQALSIFLTAGVFMPGDGYRALDSVNYDVKGAIVEVMLGAKVSY